MPGDDHAGTAPALAGAEMLPQALTVRTPLILLGMFVVAILPLLATPVLPLIDFYNHMARYHVLSHLKADPFLQQNYAANWTILPNIGLDVIVVGLMRLLGGFGPHATITLIFAVQFGGVLFFNRCLAGRWSPLVGLLTVPLLYSFILNWGFANFLLGLGLVFWAAGWWLAQRHRLALALPVACLFALAIFFVHGVAFALYGILVASLEIGLFLAARPRRLQGLALAMLPLAAQAVVPLLLFLATKTARSAEGLTNADESVVRLSSAGALGMRIWELCRYRLLTILRVAEGPSLAFDAIVLLVSLLLLLLLFRRGRLAIVAIAWPALAVAALLVIVVPPAMFGVGAVADRMPLFFALLLVGALRFQPRGDALERGVIAGLGGLVALRLAATAIGWASYATDHENFVRVAAALPRGVLVETVAIAAPRGDDDARRCQMFGPLLIAEHGAAGRLFANEDQQPLRIIGPLAASIEAAARPGRSRLSADLRRDAAVAAAVRGGFPWLLICDGGTLVDRLPAGAVLAASAGRFALVNLPLPAAGGPLKD